jgi:hypothetical protein
MLFLRQRKGRKQTPTVKVKKLKDKEVKLKNRVVKLKKKVVKLKDPAEACKIIESNSPGWIHITDTNTLAVAATGNNEMAATGKMI